MRFVVLDFESYFADDYTLSKLSTEEYIRDPRFEAHGAAIKWAPDRPAVWYDEPQLRHVLKETDWSDVCLIHHHAQFDALILTHHYGVHPKMWACTLSMARLLIGNHLSVSLESVRKHFGMAAKTTPYNAFKNRHWREMTPELQRQVADGACDEVESIWKIFCLLAKDFPREEYEVVDEVVRMFVEPALGADVDMLARLWESEADKKQKLLESLNVDATQLQSAAKFQELLEVEGVEIEYKKGKNGDIPAFAKNDDFMRDLLEHPNDRVRTLAEARLGVKSTLLQTRAETLGFMAGRGSLCVYLRYAGAGTLRPSGGDGCNWLNFKRGSDIRRAILAPKGYLLAPVDSSQIECRVLHYLAGGPDEPVVEKFRRGEDPYVDLASLFYRETIYKPRESDPRRDEMIAKRGMGKQGRLMCGYGAAGKQFKATAAAGLYGPPLKISIEDANDWVKLYRQDNTSICAKNTGYWAQAERMLSRLAGGAPMDWGPLRVREHRIYLPNGCPLIYDTIEYYKPDESEWENLKEFERDGYWRVKTRHGWKKMWGSKLVQNICEAVARVIVTQAQIRLKRSGYRSLNHPYDELLMLIPQDGREQEHLEICKSEMRKTPDWLPGLPLECEAVLSQRYAK